VKTKIATLYLQEWIMVKKTGGWLLSERLKGLENYYNTVYDVIRLQNRRH